MATAAADTKHDDDDMTVDDADDNDELVEFIELPLLAEEIQYENISDDSADSDVEDITASVLQNNYNSAAAASAAAASSESDHKAVDIDMTISSDSDNDNDNNEAEPEPETTQTKNRAKKQRLNNSTSDLPDILKWRNTANKNKERLKPKQRVYLKNLWEGERRKTALSNWQSQAREARTALQKEPISRCICGYCDTVTSNGFTYADRIWFFDLEKSDFNVDPFIPTPVCEMAFVSASGRHAFRRYVMKRPLHRVHEETITFLTGLGYKHAVIAGWDDKSKCDCFGQAFYKAILTIPCRSLLISNGYFTDPMHLFSEMNELELDMQTELQILMDSKQIRWVSFELFHQFWNFNMAVQHGYQSDSFMKQGVKSLMKQADIMFTLKDNIMGTQERTQRALSKTNRSHIQNKFNEMVKNDAFYCRLIAMSRFSATVLDGLDAFLQKVILQPTGRIPLAIGRDFYPPPYLLSERVYSESVASIDDLIRGAGNSTIYRPSVSFAMRAVQSAYLKKTNKGLKNESLKLLYHTAEVDALVKMQLVSMWMNFIVFLDSSADAIESEIDRVQKILNPASNRDIYRISYDSVFDAVYQAYRERAFLLHGGLRKSVIRMHELGACLLYRAMYDPIGASSSSPPPSNLLVHTHLSTKKNRKESYNLLPFTTTFSWAFTSNVNGADSLKARIARFRSARIAEEKDVTKSTTKSPYNTMDLYDEEDPSNESANLAQSERIERNTLRQLNELKLDIRIDQLTTSGGLLVIDSDTPEDQLAKWKCMPLWVAYPDSSNKFIRDVQKRVRLHHIWCRLFQKDKKYKPDTRLTPFFLQCGTSVPATFCKLCRRFYDDDRPPPASEYKENEPWQADNNNNKSRWLRPWQYLERVLQTTDRYIVKENIIKKQIMLTEPNASFIFESAPSDLYPITSTVRTLGNLPLAEPLSRHVPEMYSERVEMAWPVKYVLEEYEYSLKTIMDLDINWLDAEDSITAGASITAAIGLLHL
jgi:hypothetical protein